MTTPSEPEKPAGADTAKTLSAGGLGLGLGAVIGSMIVPGVGTVLGGALGSLVAGSAAAAFLAHKPGQRHVLGHQPTEDIGGGPPDIDD